MRVPVRVYVCVHALRIVSTDKILRFINIYIIIIIINIVSGSISSSIIITNFYQDSRLSIAL